MSLFQLCNNLRLTTFPFYSGQFDLHPGLRIKKGGLFVTLLDVFAGSFVFKCKYSTAYHYEMSTQ